jgi:hypothetical protein
MQPHLLQKVHTPVVSQVLLDTQGAERAAGELRPFLMTQNGHVCRTLGPSGHKTEL